MADNTWATLTTLAVGAMGAIAAIYLKEAVQAAVQRRVIASQLFGYVISWRGTVAKYAYTTASYEKVKERMSALERAATQSDSELEKVHAQQYGEREEYRKKLRTQLTETLPKTDRKAFKDPATAAYFTNGTVSLAEQRKLLLDAKTFISDRDAAMLGKAPAMNVVQFRTSLVFLMLTLETLLKIAPIKSEGAPEQVANLVDSFILYGEEVLEALIRLERNVDHISSKSLFALTLDILKGR